MSLSRWLIFTVFVFIISTSNNLTAQDVEDLMDMSLDDLLNIEVTTASKSAEKISDAPGVISVVTKDELERFGGTTLSDILNRVPSLTSTTTYFTDRSVIASRGDLTSVNSGHTLLLINGRPLRELQEGGISSDVFESFPVNIIERIEVIKGPGSVLYGTTAFSAVINVITEKTESNNFEVSGLTDQSGSFGTINKAHFTHGELSVLVAGRYLKRAEEEVEYHRTDATSGAVVTENIKVPNTGTGGFLSAKYKNLTLMSSYNEWDYRYFIRGQFGVNNWQKSFNNLGYSLSLKDNWSMDFNLTYTRSWLDASNYPFIKRNSSDMVAEWTNYITLSTKSKLVFGTSYNSVSGRERYFGLIPTGGPVLTILDGTKSSFAFFSQMDYQIQNNFKLIAGFQANKVQDIDLDIVPRAGAIWYPHQNINIKALYSQAFRAPSIMEFGLDHPALKGNPNLIPEKVATFDLGVNYLGDHIQGGINFFRSEHTKSIIPDRTITPGLYRNLGEVTFQGLELEGKYYVNKNLFITGSTLYQTNEDVNGVKNVTPIANISAKAGVSYRWHNGVTLSLFDIYQGDLDDRYNTQLNPNPGAYNLLNLFARVHLNKAFNLNMSQNFFAELEVNNLLDKEVWAPDWGGIAGESIPLVFGREIQLKLSASLK